MEQNPGSSCMSIYTSQNTAHVLQCRAIRNSKASGLRSQRAGMVRGSNPDKVKIFFSSSSRPDRLWDPLRLLFNGWRCSFPRVKRLGREADHSSPSSAEIKNLWSCTSNPLNVLYGVDRIKFNFTLPVVKLNRHPGSSLQTPHTAHII